MKEPEIKAGILLSAKISFVLHGDFMSEGVVYSGAYDAVTDGEKIIINQLEALEWTFIPLNQDAVFELKEVVIGIGFHWQRFENQIFRGSLKLMCENKLIRAINLIAVEDYLSSVISSEMSAHASAELLKAHAVISRSWLMKPLLTHSNHATHQTEFIADNQLVRWYERDAHTGFDVCADDHCQRYQGITREVKEKVKNAIQETSGLVLMYEGEVCDARYYKSCGGATETFDTCWAEENHPYLQHIADRVAPDFKLPDLKSEENARDWINANPEAFCNTRNEKVLAQVLNDYDRETMDFYRWKKVYSGEELSFLVNRKSGIDFGEILDLIPVKRGPSGRIYALKIVGTKLTMTVGKELEIRKWLSDSHLYSSAFLVEKENAVNQIPVKFIIKGAGWGHGVGLCQIGAAMMAEEGYSFQQILKHYFRNANIEKIW